MDTCGSCFAHMLALASACQILLMFLLIYQILAACLLFSDLLLRSSLCLITQGNRMFVQNSIILALFSRHLGHCNVLSHRQSLKHLGLCLFSNCLRGCMFLLNFGLGDCVNIHPRSKCRKVSSVLFCFDHCQQ